MTAGGEHRLDGTGWRVAILGETSGEPIGAGVLLADGHLLTCAHVVARAIGADSAGPAPSASVRVGFAGTRGETGWALVRPDGWFPARDGEGDFAVLTLATRPPVGTTPAPLRNCGAADGRTILAYGYPPRVSGGMWAVSQVIGRGGGDPEWVQLDGGRSTGGRIAKGYSGAGVWDPTAGAVIGLVVAEYRDAEAKVAWMLPAETLTGYWPPLRELLAEDENESAAPEPRRLSVAELAELTDALLAVPFMLDPGERRSLVARLRPEMAAAVPYSARARTEVLNMLQTCQDYEGGIEELLGAVLATDPDSSPSRRLRALSGRLLGG